MKAQAKTMCRYPERLQAEYDNGKTVFRRAVDAFLGGQTVSDFWRSEGFEYESGPKLVRQLDSLLLPFDSRLPSMMARDSAWSCLSRVRALVLENFELVEVGDDNSTANRRGDLPVAV